MKNVSRPLAAEVTSRIHCHAELFLVSCGPPPPRQARGKLRAGFTRGVTTMTFISMRGPKPMYTQDADDFTLRIHVHFLFYSGVGADAIPGLVLRHRLKAEG
jgi:hypothetical protein